MKLHLVRSCGRVSKSRLRLLGSAVTWGLFCLILPTVSSSLQAQTRVYLPSTTSAAVSPSYSVGWEDTAAADRRALTPTSGGSTTHTLITITDSISSVTDTDLLARQYVSPPLNGAQTITGTVKGQIKVSESAAGQNARPQMTVYIVSNDGTTVRGVLLDFSTDALSSEFSTNNVNRKFPLAAISPATLSSVSASDCDRIVVEYGSRNHSAGTGADVRFTFGDEGALDLAENETQTAANDPWLEFSQVINFNAEGPCGGGGAERRVIVVN